MNSLDPRAKRLRGADRSLQQARSAVTGALLVLQEAPHAKASSWGQSVEALQDVLENLDRAAALLDDARLEAADED